MTLDSDCKVSHPEMGEELARFWGGRALYLERGDVVRVALVTFGVFNVPSYDDQLPVKIRARRAPTSWTPKPLTFQATPVFRDGSYAARASAGVR